MASTSLWETLASSLTSRGKPMPPQFWQRAWKKGGWIRRLYGLTSPPSTLDAGVDSWIASLAATRARETPLQDAGSARTTSGSWPIRCCESSTKAGRLISSARTSRGTPTDNLRLSSRHWKGWAAGLRLEYSARKKSGRLIAESDFSSWPTAVSQDSESAARHTTKTGVMHSGTTLTDATRTWQTPRACSGERSSGANRTELVNQWQTPATDSFRSRGGDRKDEQGLDQEARSWATPTAHERTTTPRDVDHGAQLANQVDSWPTPIARDHRSIHAGEETMEKNSRPLSEVVGDWDSQSSPPDPATQDGPTSSDERRTLNPRFVNWLMSWPIGWTSLEPVATEWCHYAQRMRGALCLLHSTKTDDRQGTLL